LQAHAYEFSLEINPHAGVADTPAEHDDLYARETDVWLSSEQRDEAYRTGLFVRGYVNACGDRSYIRQGTDLASVAAACARHCREEHERLRGSGQEPRRPKANASAE
jgi:hypothetical protein